MEHYIKECVRNFCIINRYVNKYFNCFPSEVINLINYHYITIYGHIDKLPFTCDKPGTYFVTKDWEFYDKTYAIYIIANDVLLDLHGHTITNHNNRYATFYIKDVINCYIENGVLKNNSTMYSINSHNIHMDDLHVVGSIGCLSGATGPTGNIGTCDKKKPITSQTCKFHHTVYNKKMLKNIPKNIKKFNGNKYH